MKRAVVLYNLGGPDSPAAVKPFLFNLFNDKAIVGAPQPVRWAIARLIAHRRAPVARAIYARMGGRSPILPETLAQAEALGAALGDGTRVFVAMRYWHPTVEETAAAVKAFAPDEICLLPLYPQFSATTTASFLEAWRKAGAAAGLAAPAAALCCYPLEQGFIAAHAALLGAALAQTGGRVRVLFSAHGLPQHIVDKGDPYQWQVERTAQAIADALKPRTFDWRVAYQSRVGPLAWLGPATADEIAAAGREGVGLIVVPLAFVSEHSETLVELDIEYRHLAERAGVPSYTRVRALGSHPAYIEALKALVLRGRDRPAAIRAATDARLCPARFALCPHKLEAVS